CIIPSNKHKWGWGPTREGAARSGEADARSVEDAEEEPANAKRQSGCAERQRRGGKAGQREAGKWGWGPTRERAARSVTREARSVEDA
ncbi:MAG: hypothetical protein AB7S26_25595, partial [Sandaracinaceae bacterium]